MDLYCVVCGSCSWNKLRNISYKEYINVCKDMAENIKNNKDITDNRLLDYIEKYKNMNEYLDEKTFNNIKKKSEFMDNLILLVQDNTIINNPELTDRNNYIDIDKENYTHTFEVYPSYYENISDEDLKKYQLIGCKFVHKDCYKYYKQITGKELKYSDLGMIKYYDIPKMIIKINYILL